MCGYFFLSLCFGTGLGMLPGFCEDTGEAPWQRLALEWLPGYRCCGLVVCGEDAGRLDWLAVAKAQVVGIGDVPGIC